MAQSTTQPDWDDRIDDAVLDYLRAADAGNDLSSQELLQCHPNLASELEVFLADQEQLASVLAPLRCTAKTIIPPVALPTIPGFEMLAFLGSGGMGEVFRARQVSLDREVAVKTIRTHRPIDPVALERFRSEAATIARLDHPNVIRVHESGEIEGRPYFAMELAQGGSLTERQKNKPLSVRAAGQLVAQLADAVAYIHRQHIIHRDLKPANVLFTSDGVPKITDLGLAKHLDSDVDGLTQPGGVVGSPRYLSVEQAQGQSATVGVPVDIFGLGAILYELLTGGPPYQGDDLDSVLQQARAHQIMPPRRVNPAVPPALERICLKAMAADPRQRYPSATALANDLQAWLYRPSRLILGTAMLAVLVLVGVIVWSQWTRSSQPLAPIAPPVLSGELVVRLWSPHGKGRQGVRVDEAGALPARWREFVRAEAQLNQPAYIYMLWLDGRGEVTPLYPWNRLKLERDLAEPPPEQESRQLMYSPTGNDPADFSKGWPLDQSDGLETIILLVRRTPLPSDVALAQVIGKLPPTRLRDPHEVAVRGFDPGQPSTTLNWGEHRGIEKEAAEIDDPLLQLMGRLREHFELIRAVRFAHQGE